MLTQQLEQRNTVLQFPSHLCTSIILNFIYGRYIPIVSLMLFKAVGNSRKSTEQRICAKNDRINYAFVPVFCRLITLNYMKMLQKSCRF